MFCHFVIFTICIFASHVQLWFNCDICLLFTCRERASGVYGTPAYFTATVLFDLIPMRVLPPCFFAAATYWMVGLRPGLWHLLTFLLLLVLSNMVRTLPSLFSSYACRTYKHANQAAAFSIADSNPAWNAPFTSNIVSLDTERAAVHNAILCGYICIYVCIYKIMMYCIASLNMYIIYIQNRIYKIIYKFTHMYVTSCCAALFCAMLCQNASDCGLLCQSFVLGCCAFCQRQHGCRLGRL